MIIEAIAFVISNDNDRLRPVRAIGYSVDAVCNAGLADLQVGVAGVVVIAGEGSFHSRARRARNQTVVVSITAANIKNAAGRRQLLVVDGVEEIVLAEHMLLSFHTIVSNVAEVLRSSVVSYVVDVRGGGCCVGWLMIVALLEPAPVHFRVVVSGDLGDVLLNVLKIKCRIVVEGSDGVNVLAHEAQRQRSIGLVSGGARCARCAFFGRPGIDVIGVQGRTPERLRVASHR